MRYLITAVLCIAIIAVGCSENEPVLPVSPTIDEKHAMGAPQHPSQIDRPYVRVFYVQAEPTPADDVLGIMHWGKPRTEAEIESQKQRITQEIGHVQEFFASQMDTHGYGRQTFKVVSNVWGAIEIVDITLKHTQEYYQIHGFTSLKTEVNEWVQERRPKFDNSLNVYFIDMFTIGACGYGEESSERAWIFCWDWRTIAHEIGHACGLNHDFRDDAYIMSYGRMRDEISKGAADWLHLSRVFNDRKRIPIIQHHLRDNLARVPNIVSDGNPFVVEIRLLYADLRRGLIQPTPASKTAEGYVHAVLYEDKLFGYPEVVSFSNLVTFEGRDNVWEGQFHSVYRLDFGDVRLPDTQELWIKMIGESSQQTQIIHLPLE